MSYKEEFNKIKIKFNFLNKMYVSKEYKQKYPLLIQLYKKEGLREKRLNKIENRKRLKEMGLYGGFI